MKTRKSNVFLLGVVTILVVALLIGFESFIQISGNRRQAYQTASVVMDQVIGLIQNNEDRIESLTESLKEDFITRAKAIAYIVDRDPLKASSYVELKKIAELMLVDEIHLFDVGGSIYAGTEPRYYGFNFDSGEQMSFFKPMLQDKTLVMCQDVTPNTAEGKMMMYAICWNEDGTRMVQVGIAPVRLLKELRATSVSEIVDGIPSYSGTDILMADISTGEIIASTVGKLIGSSLYDAGIDISKHDLTLTESFSGNIGEINSYCTLTGYNDYVILITVDKKAVNTNVVRPLLMTLLYMIAAVLIIYLIIKRMTSQLIEEQKCANTDQMTGFFNRRAYERELDSYSDGSRENGFMYVSLDLNGLKATNDSLGHDAGDKLIKGAADCIEQCFGKYGRLYRTGGDEFAAIIFTDRTPEELRSDLLARTTEWSESNALKLSVSCGIVIGSEHENESVYEISKAADALMYEDKHRYYVSNGIDRRRRRNGDQRQTPASSKEEQG